MRKFYNKFMLVLIGFCLIVIFGCSKKAVPGSSGLKRKAVYDSVSFDYAYAEALKLKLLGNQGEALRLFEQCISINPEADAVYFQIAQITIQAGDIANAKKYALKAAQLDEKNMWYLTLIGNIYAQVKNLDSAAYFYEKAVKYFPAKENLKLNLGNIYTESGNYKKANEIYSYLEDKYGDTENLGLYIVKNLVNEEDYDSAEKKVRALIEKYPDELLYSGLLAEIYRKQGETEKAAEIYRVLMEREPGNPQTLFSLIDFLRTEGDFEEVFRLLNSLIINDKISREDKAGLFADIIQDDSMVIYHGKEIELSLLVLESEYQDDDGVKLLRPELYIRQGRNEIAIERLNELIKQNPGNYYAWEKLLLTYLDKQDYDNLFISAGECATRFNMSFLAKILYASAALEKKEYKIADEELKKAKILAGDQNEMILQVLTMEADLYYRMKDYAKSFDYFNEALKINPEDMVVLNNYAYYLAEQNMNLKEAERMAKLVIEKEKDNTTYLDTYAWVLFKRGKKKEAGKIMESIILNNKEEDAEWFEHYGYIMKSLRKCDVALKYWKKAVGIDPGKTYLIKEIENCIKKNQ